MKAITENTISIILVDDHPIVRQGIARLLEAEKDLRICGEAGNAADALRLIETSRPDMAIIDIFLDGQVNGIDLVKAVRERYPKTATLVLSMHEESTYAERAIRAGARGYIPKNEAPKKIVEAIRTIARGELYISKSISDKIINKLFNEPDINEETDINVLSNRELEVFHLIGSGLESREIAARLNLSVHTVESHRRNIKEKLGIAKNSELIASAAQWVMSKQRG